MSSLYVHIPFCKQKCYYCDFLSFPENNKARIERYLDFLIKELGYYREYKFKSIYIGGGTPSILNEDQLERLLKSMDLYIDNSVETTIEVNPESFSNEKFHIITEYGINRISIGIQSFSNAVLKFLNRPTRAEDIFNCINILKRSGYDNFNVDLIIGIQSYNQYLNDLRNAVDLEPSHISVYLLNISENTKLHEITLKGEFNFLNEKKLLDLYYYSCEYLNKSGYMHYEISNFSKPDHESIHNLNYWLYGDYVGVGLDAVSKIGNRRTRNTSSFKEYFSKLSKNELPIESVENLDRITQLKEKIMLGLRTNRGFKVDKIRSAIVNFKRGRLKDFESLLGIMIDNSYAKVKDGNIILTEKGFASSNYIISNIFELID